MDPIGVSESLPSDQEEAKGMKICLESDVIYTTSENDCVAENDEMKEVEEDLELLELNDGEVSDSTFFKPKELNHPLSSPRLETKNRRYTLRPKKRPETTNCDDFSSTTNRKRCPQTLKSGCLETIFENPVWKNGSITVLGKAKLKRYLSFDSFVSKAKLRHRKLKLKRLSKGTRKKSTPINKVSIEDIKLKLKGLDDDEDEWMDLQE